MVLLVSVVMPMVPLALPIVPMVMPMVPFTNGKINNGTNPKRLLYVKQARLEIDGEKMIIYQNAVKEGVPDVKVTRIRKDENTLVMVTPFPYVFMYMVSV